MGSTLSLTKLVDRTPPNPYIFSPNDVKNTTLFANTIPLYTITTDIVADTPTHVNDARTGRRIATITRREIFPDTVMFSDRRHNSGKPISVHKWLRKGKFPENAVHLIQTPVGIAEQYFWKSDATHRLGLYQEKGDDTQPQCFAYLQPASSTRPMTLFLDPTVEPIRDEIFVACLILEQRLRVMERNINVGGGNFEGNKTVFGQHVHT